jgi:hypothetical protein
MAASPVPLPVGLECDLALEAFCTATSRGRATARRFLSVAGWEVAAAVSAYLDSQSSSSSAAAAARSSSSPSRRAAAAEGHAPARKRRHLSAVRSPFSTGDAALYTERDDGSVVRVRMEGGNVKHTVRAQLAPALSAAAAAASSGPSLADTASAMAPENARAIEFIATSTIQSNEADRKRAVERLQEPSDANLDKIIEYLQSCPKIIHFPIKAVLPQFLADTHYRNQFETSTSRGTLSAASRKSWEAELFGNAYTTAAPATRPKYGVVNYDRDPLGCKRARTQYGQAFLVLQNVEDRVTYSWGDSGQLAHTTQQTAAVAGGRRVSGGTRSMLAFGIWMSRILASMPVEDLLLLERLASGQNGIGEVQLTQYLEFQVHGPIRFAEDVASVVVPESLRQVQVSMPASPTPVKLVSLVEKFCRKFDTMVDWAPPPPPGSLGAAATAAAAAADARRAMDHRSTVGTGGLER